VFIVNVICKVDGVGYCFGCRYCHLNVAEVFVVVTLNSSDIRTCKMSADHSTLLNCDLKSAEIEISFLTFKADHFFHW